MRAYNKTGPLSVHAIAGAYVILLGIDMEEAASEGVLGFGIERIEHGHGNRRAWLQALKVFPDVPVQEGPVSTEEHPIQGFLLGRFHRALRSRLYLQNRCNARRTRRFRALRKP